MFNAVLLAALLTAGVPAVPGTTPAALAVDAIDGQAAPGSCEAEGGSGDVLDHNLTVGQPGAESEGSDAYSDPVLASGCTEESWRSIPTGECCFHGGEEQTIEQCQGGEWVLLQTFCVTSSECGEGSECIGPPHWCGPYDPRP